MSDGEDVGKYRVENQQLVQGQIVGDYATVHIHPPPLNSSPISPTPSIKQVWNVPYPRNTLFTGHEDILTQLATLLQTGQPTALSGLGGIGKTHLALEYAYRHKNEYQTVLWAQADSRETLVASFLILATFLDLPEKDAQESTKVIAAVQNWLRTSMKWLMILDNADDLIPSRDFLPPSFGGHVLLTTRAQAMGRFAHRLEVETLPLEQGTLFLLRRIGLLAPSAPIGQALERDQRVASEITSELGGLPLALDQAGAYIEETGCSLTSYRHLYQQRRASLLAERRGFINDHPLPIATTWKLSFEQVEQRSPAGADLLRVCAFLAPDAIPETVFMQGASHLGPHLAVLETDDMVLDKAIEALKVFSLVKRDAGNQTLSIHRLVQVVIKDQLEEKNQKQWAERAVQAVNKTFPSVEHQNWSQCELFLPHALVCSELTEQYQLYTPQAVRLLNQIGIYFQKRARYQEAEPFLKRALAIRERQLGVMHPDTAGSLNNLAALYQRQGKYGEAEPFLKRALAIREEQLEAIHPDMAQSLNNLAELYREQGKYGQAEPLYEQAITIREQLGAIHPDTASSLNNLAKLYQTQGKYGQAEPLYQRALAIDKQVYGLEHPEVATDLNNLAELYREQGKYEQAEQLYEQALVIREEQLGAMHPDTANSLNNLALLYDNQEKYEQAELLYKRALAICEKQLGAMHPDTANSLNNLAGLYRSQKKYREAELLFKRALAISEQRLGAMHISSAAILNNLALLYYEQGKHEQAEPLYERALAISEQQLGVLHPNTATSLNNLALLYRMQRKDEQAEPLLQRALAIRQEQLGEEHLETAKSLDNLATLYYQQGKYEQAEPLLKRALTISERQLGVEHPTTQIRQGNYAVLLQKMGRE